MRAWRPSCSPSDDPAYGDTVNFNEEVNHDRRQF
jgi:hypothetical protein